MNQNADTSELPELTDEDIELLYAICQRASQYEEPPIKALFAAYDSVFAEQNIEQEHDDVIFRYLMRVGDIQKSAYRERYPGDLADRLRDLLEAQGITVVDPQDEETQEPTTTSARAREIRRDRQQGKRRVSFHDARMEETWLSEHSEPVNPSPQPARSSLLSLPPRRFRNTPAERRTRSISSHRDPIARQAAPKDFQQFRAEYGPKPRDQTLPMMFYEPSQTQLEQNAEAFESTSALRSGRKALRLWHEHALQLQQQRDDLYSVAAAHDRHVLLKQTLDHLRQVMDDRREEQRIEAQHKRLEERCRRYREFFLLRKAFTHWATSCAHEKLKTKVAQRHVLKVTYFRRWRAIATTNQMKMRSILARKYLAVWREKTARRLLWQEQAAAYYEETLLKKCTRRWFWAFCDQRVEGWDEQWIKKRALKRLIDGLFERQEQHRQAENLRTSYSVRRAFQNLHSTIQARQGRSVTANAHHNNAVTTRTLRTLYSNAKLAPIERDLKRTLDFNLKRKVFKIWHLHLDLTRQAIQVDRKRILQSAWTDWNDALRCKALAQKIDERLLVENLYRWVLQERLRLFQRTTDERLASRALQWWVGKVRTERDKLVDAEIVFVERQRRRSLAFGMLSLNIAMRAREDAERAAIELANSRALPKALDVWRQKAEQVKTLAKWSVDARFYCLASSSLKVWKERTGEHKQNRMRDAYAQVRARIKIRVVGSCLESWRVKVRTVKSMDGEANSRLRARTAQVATRGFDHWRAKTNEYANMNVQAAQIDHQKLLTSVFEALKAQSTALVAMDQQAEDFRRDVDLSVLAGALKRLQWATFTATRKVESAEALWARNRDQHVKQMLRHWTSQATAKRANTRDRHAADTTVPESPSLRPASRAALRGANAYASSPPRPDTTAPATPGYMRSTPSRARRAGRFRPLPTPAHFTPMAFNSAYLTTTPAPIPPAESEEGDQSLGDLQEGLTPQVTPFARKLRAGGIATAPFSALKGSVFGRSAAPQGDIPTGGTNKSVRFAGGSSRFRPGVNDAQHLKFS